MKKAILWTLLVIGLVGFLGIAIPVYTHCGPSGAIATATSNVKQVALGIALYANDHQGHLPKSLEALSPEYIPDKAFLAHSYLTMPNAVLADLPPESIILFQVVYADRPRQTQILIVHPNSSVECKQP